MDFPFDKLVGKAALEVSKQSGGINNPTYKVVCEDGSIYIVQFSGEKCSDKAIKQPLIVDLLKKKTNLPIANVITTDTSKTVVDKEYVVSEYLPGALLKEVSDSFGEEEIKTLYKDIAQYLSSLHSIRMDSFGEFVVQDNSLKVSPQFDSAKEQVLDEQSSFVQKAKGTPFEKHLSELTKWLEENVKVFGEDITPCLTHNDFSNTNLLVLEDGSVSGVLDLDNVFSSNNVADIYRIYHNFVGEKKVLALKTFFEHYTVTLPKNFEKQIKFYESTHVLAYIDCWEQIVQSYTKKELEEMTKKMNKDLKILLRTKIV